MQPVLMRATPEDLGIRSEGIQSFLDALAHNEYELHSFMLLRHGRIAAEGWWAPYTRELPHMLYSLSKSFTATAAMMAVEEGRFHLDDAVLPYFSAEAPQRASDALRAMRIRDLLCMGTGHETEPVPKRFAGWEKAFLSHPVVYQPGTHFLYNSMATFMVSSLIQRTTGEKLVDYLMPRLFEPLGIPRPLWEENGDCISCGGWGLNLRTEDIARFAQFLLQEGRWEGKQLLSAHAIRQMTGYQIDNSAGREKDWAQGYGFQFWRMRQDTYRGDGMHCQFCIIMPKWDAALVITAGSSAYQGIVDCVFEHLTPAMFDALPPNPGAVQALAARLQALALPSMPLSIGSSIAPELLDAKWVLSKEPEAPMRSAHLSLHKDKLTVRIARGYGREPGSTIQAGIGNPLPTFVYMQGRKMRAVAQAAITQGGGVLVQVQIIESPYRLELEFAVQQGSIVFRMRAAPNGDKLSAMAWTAAERA